MSTPKPSSQTKRIELLEKQVKRIGPLEEQATALSTQVAVLSTQIENVAKFLALGIATQMQSELTTAGAPPTMQDQLRAALQADAAQS